METPSLFARVIQDHLELKRRNSELDGAMPLERYHAEDPFDNHPLFKTEEQARIEETLDGEPAVQMESEVALTWPGAEVPGVETSENVAAAPDAEVSEDTGLWSKSRDFDWGD
ncbi:MAG: hypothetical protein H0T13_03785 [Actinobacteria bacterium]|nr:hypothetical protein [Actinomycetota bacterium]